MHQMISLLGFPRISVWYNGMELTLENFGNYYLQQIAVNSRGEIYHPLSEDKGGFWQ